MFRLYFSRVQVSCQILSAADNDFILLECFENKLIQIDVKLLVDVCDAV